MMRKINDAAIGIEHQVARIRKQVIENTQNQNSDKSRAGSLRRTYRENRKKRERSNGEGGEKNEAEEQKEDRGKSSWSSESDQEKSRLQCLQGTEALPIATFSLSACLERFSICGVFSRVNSNAKGCFSGLVMDAKIGRNKIRALVDTGSGVTLVRETLAGAIVPLQRAQKVLSANTEEIEILGKTTIDFQVKKGISIPVTGLVVKNLNYDVHLGNDFHIQYKAKIHISEDTLEIVTQETKVKIATKLHGPPVQVALVDADPGESTRPLRIFARLNGYDTIICIDTGTPVNVIRQAYVNPQKIRPVENPKLVSANKTPLNFLGETDIELLIGGTKFRTAALVAQCEIPYPLLVGNSFNKKFVELIDFEKLIVGLKIPDCDRRVTTQALVIRGMMSTAPLYQELLGNTINPA